MPKFRKRPIVVDADQWFKNGDHPEDGCRMLHPDPESATQFEPHYVGEGKVVRRYRRPDDDENRACEHCGKTMVVHGWIDTLEAGHNVCPGDWIITGISGERYPCKHSIFIETYDPVEDTDS